MKITNPKKFKFFKNLIKENIFNYSDVDILKKDLPNVEAITPTGKLYGGKDHIPEKIDGRELSLVMINAFAYKKKFKTLSDFFIKMCNLNYLRRDVHVYYSPDEEAAVFGRHKDPSFNFILQCQGKSRWIVDRVEFPMDPGDVVYIPCFMSHQCVPLGKRVSLSFAYWSK